MYNKVFLIGRLTKDPEVRYTPSGIAVAHFTLAINRPGKKNASGQTEADFLRVVAWRRLAEICGEYLKKGRLVSIEGRLQLNSFMQEGVQRVSADIVADNMQMLERKDEKKEAVQMSPASEAVPF
jgi:single-strand DNA-binding protein